MAIETNFPFLSSPPQFLNFLFRFLVISPAYGYTTKTQYRDLAIVSNFFSLTAIGTNFFST
jgi:hypothetical protein